MSNKTCLHGDLLFMNVSWTSGDLQLYENQSGFGVSVIYTVINSLILLMAFIVHKAVYKLLARLPDRAINHIIKPSMVSSAAKPNLFFSGSTVGLSLVGFFLFCDCCNKKGF